MYHRVQLGASLTACPGVNLRTYSEVYLGAYWEVYLGAYTECTWERLESLLGSVSQAGWECTIECNQECTSERTWERGMKCI